MARARVELIGCSSYVKGRHTFAKHVPQMLTDEDLIEHLKSLGVFRINYTEPPTPVPKKKELPVVEAKAPESEPEEDPSEPPPDSVPDDPPGEETTPDMGDDPVAEDEKADPPPPKKKTTVVVKKKKSKKRKGKGKK